MKKEDFKEMLKECLKELIEDGTLAFYKGDYTGESKIYLNDEPIGSIDVLLRRT
jgi:hypothetical protein